MSLRILSAFALTLALSCSLLGQSRVPPRAVVNAASFARPGLPQGALARGSIFSVFGENIGPESFETVSEFPLGDSLGGVSIEVAQGEETVAAIPVFVSAGQVNAILPSDAPLGPASLRVTNGVRRLNPVPVEIVSSQLGVFTANGTGFGPGIAQNFVSQSVQPINAPSTPATPGQVLTIWATGLGAVDFPDNEAPVPGNLNVALKVWIGGVPVDAADLLYFGRSPCCAGVDQIIVRVPENAPLGCYVPLEMQVGDSPAANTVTLAITENGESCQPNRIISGGIESGWFGLAQARVEETVDRSRPTEYSVEYGAARLRSRTAGPFPFDRLTAIPPAGSCLSYNFAGGLDDFYGSPAGQKLDAGPEIRSHGPRGVARWRPSIPAAWDYANLLGGESSTLGFLGLLTGKYLLPGGYQLTSSGGADVPAFDVPAVAPDELVWANRDTIRSIDRGADLEVIWAQPEAQASMVLILGGATDRPSDSSYLFVCAADPDERRFMIPRRTLAGAPASRSEPGQSYGFLYVGAFVGPQELTIEGLDEAAAYAVAGQAKTVLWE